MTAPPRISLPGKSNYNYPSPQSLRISCPVLYRTYLVILSGKFLKLLTQITYSVFHYTPDKIICDSSAKIKKETLNIYTITSFFLKNMYY